MRAQARISLDQGWLARASRRVVVVRIVKLAPLLVVGVVPPVELPQRVPAAVEAAFGEAAEKEAEELGQDLVRDKHNERAQQDEPSSSEYHKGDHVEGAIAVILTVRIGELDDVDFVLVAKTCSEVVQLLLANQRVQGVGANSMPEDPPSDRDHPHNDGDHEHDVVHHVATKLAETASHVIAASLVVLDAPQALDDGYPKEEEQTDAGATKNQHPGDVRLCWAVGVRVARRNRLQAADHSHEEEKRESEHIENPNSPNFPLLAIREEALTPPPTGTAASHSASALPLLFSPSWRSHKLLTSSLLTHSITILRSPSPRRDLGQRRSHITSVHTAVNAIDHKLSLDLFDAVLVVLQGDAHLIHGHIQPHR